MLREDIIYNSLKQLLKDDISELRKRNLLLILSGSYGQNLLYLTGKKMGRLLAVKSKIETLGDIVNLFEKYFESKVILLKEKRKFILLVENTKSCVENIGIRTCFYEAGIISGVFSQLIGRYVPTVETRCKSEGFEFCEFEVFL